MADSRAKKGGKLVARYDNVRRGGYLYLEVPLAISLALSAAAVAAS